MVFGWGRKKEPEPQVPQTQEVLLSGVPDIVSQMLELREFQTVSEIKSHRDQVGPLLQEISHIGRMLEQDDLKVDDIDKNIRIIVVRGKKQVIDVIKKDIVDLPDVFTYDDAVLLHNTLNQILKKVGDALGRQTRVIHIFAKKYAGKLKDILAEINSSNAEIKKLLTNLDNSRSMFEDINDSLKQISSLKGFNADAKQRISSLNDSLAACENKMATCKESIKNIKSSTKYSELLKQEDLLNQLQLQKTQLNNRILDQFTKISRPLGRYEYSSSLDKEQKLLLSRLIQSPADVLTQDNRDTIAVILENVKKSVSSGSVSVKDKAKALSQITGVEGILDDLISEISSQISEQAAVKNHIADLTPAELPVLEKDLAKFTYNKSDIESKIQSLSGEISENKSRIPHIINEIEIELRQFSHTRYTIIPEN